MNKINLTDIAILFPRANTDAKRLSLFLIACQNKAVQLALEGNAQTSYTFAKELSALATEWVLAPKKWSLASLFKDPYKPLRQKTVEFAAKWSLDEQFRIAMTG
jgi:hypothetical protein